MFITAVFQRLSLPIFKSRIALMYVERVMFLRRKFSADVEKVFCNVLTGLPL